jgi:hypothetical protein
MRGGIVSKRGRAGSTLSQEAPRAAHTTRAGLNTPTMVILRDLALGKSRYAQVLDSPQRVHATQTC